MWKAEGAEAWKGEGAWPERRLRWLAGHLALVLVQMPLLADAERRVAILAALIKTPGRFAYRVPDPVYRGQGQSAWYWKVDVEAVRAAAQEAFWADLPPQASQNHVARDRAREAERFPTLEEYLSALHGGRIRSKAPHEAGAARLLGGDDFDSPRATAFREGQAKRARQWPRICRECGAEFTWAQVGRAKAVRCGACAGRRGDGADSIEGLSV